MRAPSSCASCMCAMASSAAVGEAYMMYAVPRLVLTAAFVSVSSEELVQSTYIGD